VSLGGYAEPGARSAEFERFAWKNAVVRVMCDWGTSLFVVFRVTLDIPASPEV
jgi:hypothetical protein